MPLSAPVTTASLGDLIPADDVTQDIGSTTKRWQSLFAQNVNVFAGDTDGNVNFNNPGADTPRGFFAIDLAGFQSGISTVNIDQDSGERSQGIISANLETYGSAAARNYLNISGLDNNVFVRSFTFGAGGINTIEASGSACTSFAYTIASGATGTADINARGVSSLINCYIGGYNGQSQIRTSTTSRGSQIFASCYAYAGTVDIYSSSLASQVQGYAYSYAGAANIHSRGSSQIVSGAVRSYGAGSVAFLYGGQYGYGSQVFGSAYSTGGFNATIQATERGSMAGGYSYATTANSEITASSQGCFARGVTASANIIASGLGSFAVGYADGNDILASASGALAFGMADTGPITASAANAVQIGPGVNALADSVQIGGAGLRLKGTTGAPGALQNGDIWEAGGYVYIRSNGISVQI